MKRKFSEHVNHTYGLRSTAKRTKPSDQSNPNAAHHKLASGLPIINYPIRYPIVVLHDIAFKMAKPQHPTVVLHDVSLETAPSQQFASTESDHSHFMELNDHCILEIYELLPITDLCTMARVSERHQKLAEYLFRVKYGGHFNMKLLMHGDDKIKIKQARQLFENFGHLITSLEVSRKWFTFDLPKHDAFRGQRQLLALINKHCMANLTNLTLADFWINSDLIMESLPIFQRLRTLNYYRLSCYCPEAKTFCHFAKILPMIFEFNGLTHELPQLIQLV